MAKVIGIDLGTTNSCVAIMEGSDPKVLTNAEGSRTTPSVVAFSESGERLMGQIARRQAITNPQNTVFAVKRLIGRVFDDPMVQKAKSLLPYEIARSDKGDAWVGEPRQELQPGRDLGLHPAEDEADRRGLPGRAGDRGGHHRAGLLQRQPAPGHEGCRAHRRAGREAHHQRAHGGLPGLRPGEEQGREDRGVRPGRRHLRHLHPGAGRRRVRGEGHQRRHLTLGGEDFDQRIIDYLADEFKKDQGIDLRGDQMALQRLKEAAEKAKCELSTAVETDINLPFITADQSGPKHMSIKLSRSKLEALCADLVERTEEPCRQGAGGRRLLGGGDRRGSSWWAA